MRTYRLWTKEASTHNSGIHGNTTAWKASRRRTPLVFSAGNKGRCGGKRKQNERRVQLVLMGDDVIPYWAGITKWLALNGNQTCQISLLCTLFWGVAFLSSEDKGFPNHVLTTTKRLYWQAQIKGKCQRLGQRCQPCKKHMRGPFC